MEQPILIITGLTLLVLGVYIFVWWRNNKSQNLISESRHKETIAAIAALKASLDTHAQSFDASAQKLTVSLTDSHRDALKKIIEELSKMLGEVKNDFNGLKSENKQFKSALNESHAEALKKLNEELSKILNEIKSPLNID